jgi:hypothetical protein
MVFPKCLPPIKMAGAIQGEPGMACIIKTKIIVISIVELAGAIIPAVVKSRRCYKGGVGRRCGSVWIGGIGGHGLAGDDHPVAGCQYSGDEQQLYLL